VGDFPFDFLPPPAGERRFGKLLERATGIVRPSRTTLDGRQQQLRLAVIWIRGQKLH
jgi:hypothetical protein